MSAKRTRTVKTYSEVIRIPTFEERYNYLREYGSVGSDKFGFDRYMNQNFYRSKEWKKVRRDVIARDLGCDMAMPGYDIHDRIIVHHLNPITLEQIEAHDEDILNPEFLICVSPITHEAIHYGDSSLLPRIEFEERKPNDTKLW